MQINKGSINKNIFDIKKHFSTSEKIKVALVYYVYSQSHFGFYASIFCATILLFGLYAVVDHTLLIGWYLVFLLIALVRYGSVKAYLMQKDVDKNLDIWRVVYILGTVLGAMCWGFAGGFLFPAESSIHATLLVMILAGMTAGAVPLSAGIISAAIFFVVISVTPLTIRLLIVYEQTHFLFGITSIIYMAYLIALAIKNKRMLVQAMGLQFENITLLKHLSDAKNSLEITNKKLLYASTHDFLTSLYTRSYFNENLQIKLKQAEQEKHALAFFYLDLDKFKQVNDKHGHQIGDILLQNVVLRLKKVLPKNTIAARLGGDEMTVVLDSVNNPEQVIHLAQQMCDVISNPFDINNYHLKISLSIGITIYPIDGYQGDVLLKKADTAMYVAKNRGGNAYHFSTDIGLVKKLFAQHELDFYKS